jgi:molybdate transport system substrate-binding protein
MKTIRTAALFILALLSAHVAAAAAEIKVLCSNGLTAVMNDVVPQFERASGHSVSVQFMGIALRKSIESGDAFDLAISQPDVVESLVKQGKLKAGTNVDVARTGMGVMVRAGAAKPDVTSIAAFKRALLDARSITYASDTAAGKYSEGVIERLGLTDQLKSKILLRPAVAVAATVARGEADLGFVVISQILGASGVELGGPFPSEIQNYFVLTGAVGSAAKEPAAASALLKFLIAPERAELIRARGMEPAL